MTALRSEPITLAYSTDELRTFVGDFQREAQRLGGAEDRRRRDLQQVYLYLADYLGAAVAEREGLH